MNHITRQAAELAAARAEIAALREGMFDLYAYLTSDKFWPPADAIAEWKRVLALRNEFACTMAFLEAEFRTTGDRALYERDRAAALESYSAATRDLSGYVATSDVLTRLQEFGAAARAAADTALYNETGPRVADGAHGECSHGTFAGVPRINGWHCRVCGQDMRDGSSLTTESQAARLMLAHWHAAHKPGRITEHDYHESYAPSATPGACIFRADGLTRCGQDAAAHASVPA